MANSVSIPSLLNNASLSVAVGCWHQTRSHESHLTPVTYIECKQAICDIPLGEKALAPLSFSRDPDAGFTVPYSWTYGNCVVQIDVLKQDDTERSNFASIFKRAFDLAVECVIKPPHLGGRGFVGDSGKLKVWIFGVDAAASGGGFEGSNRSVAVDTA